MNIVIYSEERLLMSQRLDKLKKQYKISEEDMNLSVYYAGETPMSEILEDALTPPFFSEYKMVVMRKPIFLTKTKQKEVTDHDIELFMDYLSHDNPSTIFVVYHEKKDFDERKKVVKALRKYAKVIDIEKVTHHQLYQTTSKAIKKRGCTIDDDALDLLISRSSDDLTEVAHQVDKLCLYKKQLTVEDIKALVTPPLEEKVYKLTEALLHHDLSSTMSIYQDLMTTNHEPIALISAIANAVRQLYQVKMLTRKGYNDKDVVRVVGMNPRAIYPVRKNAERFEFSELTKMLNDLSELDIKIKSGVIDKKKGLELFLMESQVRK